MNRPDGPADSGAEPENPETPGTSGNATKVADAPGRMVKDPQRDAAEAGGTEAGATEAGSAEQAQAADDEAQAQAAGDGAESATPHGVTETDAGEILEHGEHGEHGEQGEYGEYGVDATGKEDGATADGSVVAQGAGGIVAAALGAVSLTGSWLGTLAGARESLIGQLQTSQGASVARQLQAVYGNQWHANALVSGVFAMLAMIVGVVVLAIPAFGAPGRPQASWIKSVSWAGVLLGVLGLLLAVLKYTDAILGLPSAS